PSKFLAIASIFFSSAVPSAYSQEVSQASVKIADKMYQLCLTKEKALKAQLDQKNKAKASVAERADLYRKLAILQEVLDQNVEAAATAKAERAMLEASGEDKPELARMMLEEASPRRGFPSRADEGEM